MYSILDILKMNCRRLLRHRGSERKYGKRSVQILMYIIEAPLYTLRNNWLVSRRACQTWSQRSHVNELASATRSRLCWDQLVETDSNGRMSNRFPSLTLHNSCTATFGVSRLERVARILSEGLKGTRLGNGEQQ